MMMFKRLSVTLSSNQVIMLFSLYTALVFNIGYWQSVYRLAHTDTMLMVTMPLFIVAALNLIMQLLFWPKLHRVLIPLLLMAGAGVSYAVMVQGIYFNADQINNIVQTDATEAAAWLSMKCVLWVCLTGILPALWYAFCVKLKPRGVVHGTAWRGFSAGLSLVVIAAVGSLSYQHYASFFRNNKGIHYQITPTNFIGSGFKALYNAYDECRPFEKIGEDAVLLAQQGARKKVLVLVVGETTRAQNWGLNPGAPDTTPQLKNTDGVINYPEVQSCGTATNVSLPCMFFRYNRTDYSTNTAKHQENLLDILKRAGLYVSWRENDGGSKGVADRVQYVDMGEKLGKSDPRCHGSLCYDAVLLDGLHEEIRAMPSDGVIVLHTNGSHGPTYYQRYPQNLRKFTPTCDTNQIQDCSHQALVNTYNNTIVAVDDMLAQTIKLLNEEQDADTAMLYLSDHGESLGENGLYLHATPYVVAPKEQTHVPMVFWADSGFYRSSGMDKNCLRQHAAGAYSQDNLFHSVLGVMNVGTKEYQAQQDMFAACRSAAV
ncbi:phosphoethanolamine transferase [Neisseria perflava]|uniref:phosphoethanolamine transferase n=1 Tax=Neisseria perflava TaxID=33053 RepID=UPI0020A1C07F|nr:phosphoethanolamine--lipid A transferase [Neisseria perflava]MCP1660116.1 lipid A ethanolaminephosphotransferase [Neisseria perflava]